MSDNQTPEPPEWSLKATEDILFTAIAAHLEDDQGEGRRAILEAITRYADAADENGGTDRDWFALTLSLAAVAREMAPAGAFGEGDGPTQAVMEDRHTGEAIDDPDAEATTEALAAGLAAMRIVAAVVDRNTDLAADIFETAGRNETAPLMLLFLAEYAASYAVDHLRGGLPPDIEEKLRAREAAAIAAEDQRQAARRPRTGADGVEFVSIEPDERDRGPAAAKVAAPHGQAVYCIGAYVPGVDGHREAIIEVAHRQIPLMDPTVAGQLCGVRHAEDVEPWQMPHTGRASANRHLRHLKRMTGRPGQLLRAWQHTGPCPGGDA